MTALEILDELRQRGVVLEVNGEALRYRAPKGVLTAELRHAVTENKKELLDLLAAPHPCTCDPLPSLKLDGYLAHAGCGPTYSRCGSCGYTWRCKLCGGCRRCRFPG